MARDLLSSAAIESGLAQLDPSWALEGATLRRAIEFADFSTAVEFVSRIAPSADELDHHPDLHLSWRWVRVELSTHSAGGITELDLQLAHLIDDVVGGLPLADPA